MDICHTGLSVLNVIHIYEAIIYIYIYDLLDYKIDEKKGGYSLVNVILMQPFMIKMI